MCIQVCIPEEAGREYGIPWSWRYSDCEVAGIDHSN